MANTRTPIFQRHQSVQAEPTSAAAQPHRHHGMGLAAAARTLLGTLALGVAGTVLSPSHAQQADKPVTVQVCGEDWTYTKVPQKVVTHDVGITEMFLHLGLGDKLVGYSGMGDKKAVAAEYQPLLDKVPMLSKGYMNLETLVGSGADFMFAGWTYGFKDDALTPALLADYGIASYVLTESCIRKFDRKAVSLQDTFTDMLNLGKIFHIEERAEQIVSTQQQELAQITTRLEGIAHRPTVFFFDSGTDIPTTAGRFAMANAMIEAAGGTNIFNDLPMNWVRGNWEDVIDRDPEWIILMNYGSEYPQNKVDFLLNRPELAHLQAVKARRFVVLAYAEATPGPRNVMRVGSLARAFHPERFKDLPAESNPPVGPAR